MSKKTKNILIKIGGWVIFVGTIIFFLALPAIRSYKLTGDMNGSFATCTVEQKNYSDGTPIDPLANYQHTTLQKIFFDDTRKNLEKVIISGNLHYSINEDAFYLRDGAFTIPLNLSNCQHLVQFKHSSETLVAVSGIIAINNNEPMIIVNGLRDTMPGWIKVLFNGAFVLVTPLVWYFIIILGSVIGTGIRKILIKLGIIKKTEIPKEPTEEELLGKKAGWSVLLAVVALPLWILNPYVGIFTQGSSIYLGYQARNSGKKNLALIGITIAGIGFIIMALIFIGNGRFSNPPENNFFDTSLTIVNKPTGTETLEIDPYISSKWHFTIHPPKNWAPDDKNVDQGFQLMFRGPEDGSVNNKPFHPAIGVSFIPLKALDVNESDLKGALVAFEDGVKKQNKDTKIIDDGIRNISGGRVQTIYFEATFTNKNVPSHIIAFITFHNGLMYLVGVELPIDRWDKYQKVIRDSLNSFDFPQTAATTINHLITLKTTMGDISFATYDNDTQETTKNFIKLAEKGFYDKTIFHRIVKGSLISGGDPTGTGTGGPGYSLPYEIYSDPSLSWGYTRGTVAMASDGTQSSGSQFFFMLADAPDWVHNYTIFGQVVEGQNVIDAIGNLPIDKNNRPLNPPQIESVNIKEIK